jgi:hypothetical protein
MYARLTTIQIKPDKIDEATDIYRKSIVPAAKSQKGFCRINFFLDRKTGKAVSLALWDCEEDALANERSHYYQEQLVKLMHLFTSPPTRDGYDVIVSE